jgi:hypothetical protein
VESEGIAGAYVADGRSGVKDAGGSAGLGRLRVAGLEPKPKLGQPARFGQQRARLRRVGDVRSRTIAGSGWSSASRPPVISK